MILLSLHIDNPPNIRKKKRFSNIFVYEHSYVKCLDINDLSVSEGHQERGMFCTEYMQMGWGATILKWES